MIKFLKNNKGITLVEVLVSVLLIVLVLTAIIVAVSQSVVYSSRLDRIYASSNLAKKTYG